MFKQVLIPSSPFGINFGNIIESPLLLSPTIPTVLSNAKSVNIKYSQPLFSFNNSYENDPRIIERVTKHFYLKTFNEWLKKELKELTYHISTNGDVSPEQKYKDDDEESIKKKIEYIEKKIFKKKYMEDILDELVEEGDVSWYKLISDHSRKVRKVVEHYLRKLIIEHKK